MGDAARRVGFGVLAVVLVVAEVVSGGSPDHLGAFTVEWLVIGYGLLALTGWLPATAGLLYAIVTFVVILAPSDTLMVGFPLLGVFAVAGDWISRGWYVPAAAVLLLSSVSQFASSPSNSQDLWIGVSCGLSVTS